MKESVLVLLYPGCVAFEVALAAELLSAKFNIVTATPDGGPLAGGSGLPLRALVSYAEARTGNFQGILVPGGDPRAIVENSEIDEILRSAHEKKVWIGAICAGPLVLAKAGILVGRRVAHGYGPKELSFLEQYFRGVHVTEELFIADEHILTAKPEAFIDFAVEIACRLGVVDAGKSGRLKDYYRGLLGRKSRSLALAIIRNAEGRILLHQGRDSLKNETFYRPLGGGIEFGETGKIATERELKEELGVQTEVGNLLATLENIFTYEGSPGHEIVLVYDAKFIDPSLYERKEMDIVESGRVVGQAVWRSVDDIRTEGANLFPQGIEAVLALNY